MSIIPWLVVGIDAGFIASKLLSRRGEGGILDLALGIAGAFIGGLIFSFMTAAPMIRFNIHSAIVAVVGTIVLLAAYHAVSERRAV